MRNDLIIALRDKMRSLQPHQFDINDWTNECGTVCCGAGWACTMPEFKKAGLRPYRIPLYTDPETGYPEYGYSAMAWVLGVSSETSAFLFSPSAYDKETPVTPYKLANRLQFLLDHGEQAFIEHFEGMGG